jgi:MoaA/NifB/PqqE/SkfB family radical SAM enzyme
MSLVFVAVAPSSHARKLPVVGEASHRTKGLVRLTMACNERCPFCNVPMEDYRRLETPDDEIEAALADFVASGEQTLTVSGGEPTLRRARLLELVGAARARGVPFVELQTNAILIDDDYARALGAAGLTSAFVSLLSDVPALHDELAGLDGAFDRCLRGIDALLAAGIAVTLNPVVARATEDRIDRYLDFVAERLPAVRSVSLSAVQPHGRAARDLDLLPDYAVLAPAVRRAQERARVHGVVLLNPYCGLPLCVGWSDGLDRSVEAIEAELGGEAPPGIDNAGNKRHDAPCRNCALRTRCGGAWHAYWEHRGGSGIAAPFERRLPWRPGAHSLPAQTVTFLSKSTLDTAPREAPTRWLMVDALTRADAERIGERFTDLAIVADAAALRAAWEGLEILAKANAGRSPQARLRVVAGLTGLGSYRAAHEAIAGALARGVEAAHLLLQPHPRHLRFVAAMQREGSAVTLEGRA